MKYFRYKLRNREGRTIRGTIRAADKQDALRKLQQDECMVLQLRDSYKLPLNLVAPRLPDHIHQFMKQLSMMIGASLPLKESLVLILRQTSIPRMRSIIEDIYSNVCQGMTLAQAMAQHPRYFDALCCSVVEAGEWGGALTTALNSYANYLDEQKKLKSSLQQALSYPIILLFVSCIVVSVLLTVAVPQIVSQLTLSGGELPTSTQLVIWLGKNLHYLLSGIAILIMAMGGALKLVKNKTHFKLKIDRWILTLPFIGTLLTRVQSTKFLMTLAILCTTKVPVAEALRLAGEAQNNLWLREKNKNAVQALTEGLTFTRALENESLLTPDQLALLSAGELAGDIESILSYLAPLQREHLQQQLLNIVKLIEPVLIFILGLVVLLVFMAIIQPMLAMSSLSL